jgi:hypothetical protein
MVQIQEMLLKYSLMSRVIFINDDTGRSINVIPYPVFSIPFILENLFSLTGSDAAN